LDRDLYQDTRDRLLAGEAKSDIRDSLEKENTTFKELSRLSKEIEMEESTLEHKALYQINHQEITFADKTSNS
jgi:hypothetical protein